MKTREEHEQHDTTDDDGAVVAMVDEGPAREAQRQALKEAEAAELVRVKCRELQHAIDAARSLGLAVQVYDQTKAMVYRIRKERRKSGVEVAFSERL